MAQNQSASELAPPHVRVATYNVSLYGKRAGEITERLADSSDEQAKRIASIVQTVRPDILLVNELDFQNDALPAKRLATNYFAVGQPNADASGMLQPITYPYLYSAASNTGLDSGTDLNQDGKLGTGNDAWGYGVYPGQYAMTVFSRFPIDDDSIRTFQTLRWASMPGALQPIDPSTQSSYYENETWNRLRLSSKNHIDVPIHIGQQVLHVLASHPTPPVFDGPEDRNGARNHDEIAFWNHYLSDAAAKQQWIVDDEGNTGGLAPDASFVVMGDLNADPDDGDGRRAAIRQLIEHPRVNDVRPRVDDQDAAKRRARYRGTGDVRTKTADFGRGGGMRVDYVLPSSNLDVTDSGVFWPASDQPESRWVGASDHRMVWIDVKPEG